MCMHICVYIITVMRVVYSGAQNAVVEMIGRGDVLHMLGISTGFNYNTSRTVYGSLLQYLLHEAL